MLQGKKPKAINICSRLVSYRRQELERLRIVRIPRNLASKTEEPDWLIAKPNGNNQRTLQIAKLLAFCIRQITLLRIEGSSQVVDQPALGLKPNSLQELVCYSHICGRSEVRIVCSPGEDHYSAVLQCLLEIRCNDVQQGFHFSRSEHPLPYSVQIRSPQVKFGGLVALHGLPVDPVTDCAMSFAL